MKKRLCLILVLGILLCGCASAVPEATDPGMTLPIFPDRESYYSDYFVKIKLKSDK